MDLEKLRMLCMNFPGATEGIKWEDHICFMVAGKIFCMTGETGHTAFKVSPDEFEELCEREGINATPYMARHKWVTVQHFNGLRTAEWRHYVSRSYDIIRSGLPKKLHEHLG